jgi:protein disulfide-isomerase A1
MKVYLLLILCITLSVHGEEAGGTENIDTETDVNELNEQTLKDFLSSHKHAYVKFYLPDCKKCKHYAPIFAKAAGEAKSINVAFGKVNAKDHPELAKEWEVSEYPTVFWVEGNKKELVQSDNFVSFAKRKLGVSGAKAVNSFDDLDKAVEGTNVFLVGLTGDDSTTLNRLLTLEAVAEKIGFAVLKTNEQDIKDAFGLSSSEHSVTVLRWNKTDEKHEDPETVELNEANLDNEQELLNILEFFRAPSFKHVDEELMSLIVEEGRPSIMLIVGEETTAEEKEKVDEVLTELSKTYRTDLLFSRSEYTNKDISLINEVLLVKPKHLPYLLITHARAGTQEDMDKFKLENVKLDKESIEGFIKDWKTGKLKSFYVSEDIPESNPDTHGIHKIVAHSFAEFLTQRNKDIIILMCTETNKACESFEERYRRVAQKFKGNDGLLIARADPNLNEFEISIPAKYPSLYFFAAENDGLDHHEKFENSVLYDGDWSTTKVTEWIIQNSRNPLKVEQLENESEINEKEASEPIDVKGNEGMDFGDMFKGADGNIDLAQLFAALGGGQGGPGGMEGGDHDETGDDSHDDHDDHDHDHDDHDHDHADHSLEGHEHSEGPTEQTANVNKDDL